MKKIILFASFLLLTFSSFLAAPWCECEYDYYMGWSPCINGHKWQLFHETCTCQNGYSYGLVSYFGETSC